MAEIKAESTRLGIAPITQSQFLYYFWLMGFAQSSKSVLKIEKELVRFLNEVPVFIAYLNIDKSIDITELIINTDVILDNFVSNMLEDFNPDDNKREFVKEVLSTKLNEDSPLLKSGTKNYKNLSDLFEDCTSWINQLELPLPEVKELTEGIVGAILLPDSIKSLKIKIKDAKSYEDSINSYLSYFVTDRLNETKAPWHYSEPYFQTIPFKKQLLFFTEHIVKQINKYERNVVVVNSDEFLEDGKLSEVQIFELLIFLSIKEGIKVENLDINFVPTKNEAISYKLKARISLPKDFFRAVTEETINCKLTLSFKGVSTAPIVSCENEYYELTSMQADNNPFLIINYCLHKAPGEYVKLQTLKSVPGVHGLTNINEALKNSAFGPKRALHIFVESSAKGIKLEPTVLVKQQELEAIKTESTNKKS